MHDKDILAREAAAQVLSGLYEVIADHTQFDALFQAMDDFLDADPDGLEVGEADWKTMFRQHFQRVGQFVHAPEAELLDSPIVYVDSQVVPAGVVNRNLDVLAANALFSNLAPPGFNSLSACFTSPNDRRRFEQLLTSNGDGAPALVSLSLPNMGSPIFVVASRSALLDVSSQTGPLVTFKVAKATWNPDLIPLLDSAYGLTAAEIEVLEGLVEHGSVSTIAEERGRSIRTVRTQLTNIFGKLGLGSQTELALFLATLTQLMTKQKRPSDVGHSWSEEGTSELRHHSIETQTGKVAYVTYGDSSGTAVLLIHSTTPPEMTPEFRTMCSDNGLFVIAPHKPGSGGTTHRSPKQGPEALTADYKAVLEAEGHARAIVAGHCSAGLYALQFAKDYPSMSLGVILVDTGAPFKGRKDLMTLPKSLRRTFLPARYIPEVLLVPHRIFAANFKRSAVGEAKVVDYFFEDSQIDQDLTRVDRTYYEITRQIIAYSFEDVDRLVADVCRWARDWSDLLSVHTAIPVVFSHGSDNSLFEISRIADFADNKNNVEIILSEGSAQLQIYQNPLQFRTAVARVIALGE